MNAEPCARPGCGHPAWCHHWVRESADETYSILCIDAANAMSSSCSCPSYRTQAQQEAWERAAELADLDLAQMYPIDLVVLFNRLLELYP